MQSIGATRERPVPSSYRGRSLDGQPVEGTFHPRHLLIAVKPACDGCRALLEADAGAFGDVSLLFVCGEDTDEPWFRNSKHPVIVAPELLTTLAIRWPPFWVLIDGEHGVIRAEGVPFGPAHIADDIRSFL